MRKVLAICILTMSFIFMVNINVYADDEPSSTPSPTPDPITQLSIVQGGSTDVNTMMYYYRNVLNEDQQKIVRFLIGSYNYMYLNSRGFSYENVNDINDYISKFDDFAAYVIGLPDVNIDTVNSRWGSNFQIYIASIITYAGRINKTFDQWIASDMRNLVIPYTSEALDAWTDYYNDPSNEGITDFGRHATDWISGTTYPFMFDSYNVGYEQAAQQYSSFILNQSPVLYTNAPSIDSNRHYQVVLSFNNVSNIIDTLYILRSPIDRYTSFRFGTYEGQFLNNYLNYLGLVSYNDSGTWGLFEDSATYVQFRSEIYSINGVELNEIISYAFNITPIKDRYNLYSGYYPYIQHVVLVDDLNTLSNRQDVYNDYTLGIINGDDWIRKPNPNREIVWLLDEQVPKVIQTDPTDPNIVNLIDPVDGDFSNQIVNNTVINNYDIVAPGVQINVPTDWFESEGNYLEYSYNYGLPFFVFVGDLFLTLGELRIFILGGIILLIVAGVLNKFLL